MLAILFGLILIGFCVCACLPQVLNWGDFIIVALKGAGPIVAAFIGIIAIFIGFADIQDKREARREEADAAKAAAEEAEKSE